MYQKIFVIFLTILGCIGCGSYGEIEYPNLSSSKFESLPQKVRILDFDLEEPTIIAIEKLNLGLAYNVFEPTQDDDAVVTVQCDVDEIPKDTDFVAIARVKRQIETNIIISVGIYVYCDNGYNIWELSHLIAHELYHGLGFREHSPNEDCLMYYAVPMGDDIDVSICYDMVRAFDETYQIPERSVNVY